ncbi:MAG: glutathione peroxidase, partial [Alphaproteobacteria bacterium PA3]
MTDETSPTALPDRLSVNPRSPYYNEEVLAQGVGIRFKGEEKTNVEEY